MRKSVMAAAAIMALAGMPAQAACWTDSEVAAAKVRDLDSMLMVSALRCRFESTALLKRYNAVVVRHRAGLVAANTRLRGHFVTTMGAGRFAETAFDQYVTSVANRYGAGADALTCVSLDSIAKAALVSQASLPALVALADRAAVDPVLPGGSCTLRLAYAWRAIGIAI